VAGREDFAEAGDALVGEEGLALGGRAGEHHEDLAVAGEFGIEPEADGGAVGVGEDGCALNDVSLLEVVVGHEDAALGEAGGELDDESGVATDGDAEGFSDGFAGEVVFGGSEAAGDEDEVSAGEGGADGGDEVALAVADDGLEVDGGADLVELLGEEERVGVLAEGGEELGADGDDFGFHKGSVASSQRS